VGNARQASELPLIGLAMPLGTTMDHTVENLLMRNLLDVFGERDAAKRQSVIAALWAADGVFADPHGRYVGYAAINDAVSELYKKFPGFVFTPIGSPQTFFDVGRQAWGHGPVGEPPKVTGLDVVIARHGRIVSLYAFIDTPALLTVGPADQRSA
jgi:hypothetical protein